jgi:hypothetical protein
MSEMITLLASTSWAPFFQTAIGALIGAGGAVAGGAFGSWFTWQRERQSVAAAFAGEVQAIMDVFRWRQIAELIPRGFKFPISDKPFPVFDANVGKIGLLPADLAAKVAVFYGYAEGIVQDLGTVNSEIIAKWSENEFKETFAESIKALMEKGDALVLELQQEAKKTWKDYFQPG